MRQCPYGDIGKVRQHALQLEPSVMPLTKFRKVTGQMFWVDCMVSAADGLLGIAYCGVYQSELFFGDTVLAIAREDADVAAHRVFYGGETG